MVLPTSECHRTLMITNDVTKFCGAMVPLGTNEFALTCCDISYYPFNGDGKMPQLLQAQQCPKLWACTYTGIAVEMFIEQISPFNVTITFKHTSYLWILLSSQDIWLGLYGWILWRLKKNCFHYNEAMQTKVALRLLWRLIREKQDMVKSPWMSVKHAIFPLVANGGAIKYWWKMWAAF